MAISEELQGILNSQYKRSAFYAQIADNNITLGARTYAPASFVEPRREQKWDGSATGTQNVTSIDVVWMSNMRRVTAVVSADGPDPLFPYIVTVRNQTGVDGFERGTIAYASANPIRGISLVAAANPLLNIHIGIRHEAVLGLLVWESGVGVNNVRILRSPDRGRHWAEVWLHDDIDMTFPKLVQSSTGLTYIFYKDYSSTELRYHLPNDAVTDWEDGLIFSATAEHVYDMQASDLYDISYDPWDQAWVLAIFETGGEYTLGYNLNADPGNASWVEQGYTHFLGATVEHVSVARAGGHDEFGSYPPGTVLMTVTRPPGRTFYFVFDLDTSTAEFQPRNESHMMMLASHDLWMDAEGGFYYEFDQGVGYPPPTDDWNKITNREVWNYELTPSTSITYHADSGFNFVQIDSHGPEVDDTDGVDHFPSFYTRSNKRHSTAFPPFKEGVDLNVDFVIKTVTGRYHNIWFVVEDPEYPETPIFKMDFYIGSDVDVGTHPHDTARGVAIWFCKPHLVRHAVKTLPEAPHGTFVEEYPHPVEHMFRGFDDNDDNERIWRFNIAYNSSTDEFELRWNNGAGWVPFVPYDGHSLGDREFVDIGTEDDYVAHATEVYWKQPRNGMWPKRFYIGCPEVKPAFEQQSTMALAGLEVYNYDPDAFFPIFIADRICLLPRINGALDVYYVEEDVAWRQPHGYGWDDVWTMTNFHSTHAANTGPDQAEMTLTNADNYVQGSLYDDLHNYHCMAYSRGGSRTMNPEDSYAKGGEWGPWQCIFFGTSDTGLPHDDSGGPSITMRMFSPLRAFSRSHATQGFSALPPPEVEDEEGEPTGEPDEQKQREFAIIYMTDFDRPADPTLPVDSAGRLMKFDDYIARYAWEEMLGNPADKLEVSRIGTTPSDFSINPGGGDTDIMESLHQFWSQLGMFWWYDYQAGGIFRIWSQAVLDRYGDPDLTLLGRSAITLPISRVDTDWGRAGNVRVSATNMESRPNVVVARVAPWPDGAQDIDAGAEWANNLPSQFAIAELYKTRTPYRLLEAEWDASQEMPLQIPAFPYIVPGMKVELELDEDLKITLMQRYGPLVGRWLVRSVEHTATPEQVSSSVTVVPVEPFGRAV